MKTSFAIGLVTASVLITVAIGESRISSLRTAVKTGETTAAPKVAAAVSTKPTAPAKDADTADESFTKTARKMLDNPAAKSMMSQGAKMAVAVMYADFVEGLHLGREESDYFKKLLGKEIDDQQEFGMKMMVATPEEQKSLAEELRKRGNDIETEIEKFLNSDEDFKSFTEYKNHLPEHQQLDSIRTAMTTKGVPLDAATESKLVDAMYRARTESKAPDLSGPNAMNELAKGNIVETFEKSWDVQQEALQGETSKILNAEQMTAFQDYQKEAKKMQLMGLKMAEQMMAGKHTEKRKTDDKSGDAPKITGTGFIITHNGYLMTNHHVVKDCSKVRVQTGAGLLVAAIIRVDAASDLALLKVTGSFDALPVVSSRTTRLGAMVATVGFPNICLQGFEPKPSKGDISSLAGIQDDVKQFQISVPVQPGNSGGALVDERGNVVGVVTAQLNQEAALATTGTWAQNVNYAVKSSYLLSFLEAVPEVGPGLLEAKTNEQKFEVVVDDVKKATVLVIGY